MPSTTYLDYTQRQPWNSFLKLSLARSNIIVIVKEPKETQNVGALTLLSMYFGRYHTHNVINGVSWIQLLSTPNRSKDLNQMLDLFKILIVIHKNTGFDNGNDHTQKRKHLKNYLKRRRIEDETNG